eukprot:TRINITY_DN85074_c0_g1_i1.p1 TRINITY_DN85074_c0_g1~~TRINITY_DN85074_c0_g1_i1.p1  ORF type:complete len:310 (+),score=57.86 TRINITY_DN85074_c0_g1_i1:67-996(+)
MNRLSSMEFTFLVAIACLCSPIVEALKATGTTSEGAEVPGMGAGGLVKQLLAGMEEVSRKERDVDLQAAVKHEGHSDDGSAHWKYLQTECLQQRQDLVVHRLARESCQNVLEIGGYYTPLPETKYFATEAAKSVELYVNVDPSVLEASSQRLKCNVSEAACANCNVSEAACANCNVSEASCATPTYRVDLPMTLGEFTSMPAAAGVQFDCVVILGAWRTQLGLPMMKTPKAAAFEKVVKAAKLVVVESPEIVELEGLKVARPLLKGQGFTEEKEFLVDCTKDAESKSFTPQKPRLKRHMAFFTHGRQSR